MTWEIEFTRSAQKQLSKINRTQAKRILDYLRKRIAPSEDPRFTGKALSGPLGEFWRYRIGDFRVICEINEKTVVVLVINIGDRGDLYQ